MSEENTTNSAANDNPTSTESLVAGLAHLLREVEDEKKQSRRQPKWGNMDVQIQHDGKAITLPSDPARMPIKEAINSLQRKLDEENMVLDVHEIIDAHPLEAAVAFLQAMEQEYGWASPVPTPGFFGPEPPHMISVQTDVDTWVQVPWGAFKIPGVSESVKVDAHRDRKTGKLSFVIHTQTKKKEAYVVRRLADVTRTIIRERSIYRGKALHLVSDNNGSLELSQPPQFTDVRFVFASELIMSRDVELDIATNVWSLIENTDLARKHRIPLKRGILFEGTYGTGKTMTSRITAAKCVANGWTFISVDRTATLREALIFAQRYQPAVVFCEDIDRGMSERNEDANDLLNTVDGLLSKDSEIMVVLTTNHVELIQQAMLRPGRLDAVISITPPDGEAVGRLIHMYSRGLLARDADLTEVGEILAGSIPASIREVVERAKLGMIARADKMLTAEDLVVAARSMKNHLALLAPKKKEPSDAEKLWSAMQAVVGIKGLDDVHRMVDEIHNHII